MEDSRSNKNWKIIAKTEIEVYHDKKYFNQKIE